LDVDDQPRLGVVAPLLRREGGQERRVGAIVLLSDPYLHLYTIVSSLHLAGESVESLLVRREGDAAVYLSPLRHRPDAPLSVGMPLTEGRVTAVMAVSGQTGVVEGVDYRGVRVISALQSVRTMDWFVVTEIDIEEALAARKRDGVAIAGISALVLLLIGALTMLAWQANRRSLLETRLAEAALGESEARHGATLRSVGDGVIATDTAARVTLMNPTAEMLTGWTQAEAMGRPLTEVFGIVNELTGERAENPADRVIREGVVLGLANHTLLISRDGTRRPVADSGAPIFDAQGTILGMVLVFRDQTEERAARRALEAREAQYRALVESTDAVAWEYAIADDRWTYIAPQVTRLLGYPPEEWQGFAFWTDHLHPDDRDWVTHYIQHCTARGKAYTLECRFRARDGRYVWLRDVASVEMEEEEPVARRGFLLDISEQRAAEESLRQSEERFRSLIQNAPVALFVEADAHIAYLNPAAARVWGAESVEELEGQPLLEHLDSRVHAAVRDRMQRLHEEGHAAPAMESVLLRMDGTPVAAEVAAVPVQYDGLDAALVFVQDISTRKEAEERLAEQMEELSRWHEATLGREMRIIELKQEVNELLARMGAPPRHET
jgi:two-component system cell cycle sensor histidine kinase/response regulator CckA